MFTGLVEDTGSIRAVSPMGRGVRFTIATAIPTAEIAVGDSVAVDGVCLTAETVLADAFTVTAGAETLAHTTLGEARVGRKVHLERALKLSDRLGGHWVQGHVDGVGRVVSSQAESETWVVWVAVPTDLLRYIVAKGSICLDGVSLTVNELDGERIRVNVIPHTAQVTRFGGFRPGDGVHVEVDILAKYVERLLGHRATGGLSLETLVQHGFAR
jgi:riboflavin synthase